MASEMSRLTPPTFASLWQGEETRGVTGALDWSIGARVSLLVAEGTYRQ